MPHVLKYETKLTFIRLYLTMQLVTGESETRTNNNSLLVWFSRTFAMILHTEFRWYKSTLVSKL